MFNNSSSSFTRQLRSWILRLVHVLVILAMVAPGLAPNPAQAAASRQVDPGETTPTPEEALSTPADLQATATVTPTPAAATLPIETPEPTVTQTPSPTSEITPAAATIASPTLTATLPITPTVTPTVFSTVSPTSTPDEPVSVEAELTLGASQAWVAPGEVVTLTWGLEEADGLTAGMLGEIEFTLALPTGFTPQEVAAGAFDPISNTLRLPVPPDLLAKGQTAAVSLQIGAEAAWPYVLTGRLVQGERSVSVRSLELKGRWPAAIEVTGGEAIAFNGLVKVSFPAEALSEALSVEIRQADADNLPPLRRVTSLSRSRPTRKKTGWKWTSSPSRSRSKWATTPAVWWGMRAA
jgi:hypothetical protein